MNVESGVDAGMRINWIDSDRHVSVYQSRSYGEAAASTSGVRWDVLGDTEGRWRIPLCVADVAGGPYRDAVSPYGYPGIFADSDMSADDVDRAWSQTVNVLRDSGIASLFLRFAPYRDGVETRHELVGLTTNEISETILLDLGDESHMWEGMQGRSRTAVRKADREGLRTRVVEEIPLNLSVGSGFRDVYETAMRRVDASAEHFHRDDYYARLAEAPDIDMRLIEVLDRDDTVVAATLLLIDQEAVHYHLSGSLISAARIGANNLMLWSAMRWAAAHGHRKFHLGGGTSRGDGLFKFKASFGGSARSFNVGQLIVSPDAYDRLVAARSRELGVSSNALRAAPFFPAYRAATP